MSGARRRLIDKNDVLKLQLQSYWKSTFDCKESVYQSDTSFVELIDNNNDARYTIRIDTSISPMPNEIAKFDVFHIKVAKFDDFIIIWKYTWHNEYKCVCSGGKNRQVWRFSE